MPIDKINNDIQSRQIVQNRMNEATSGKKETVQNTHDSVKKIALDDNVIFSQDAKKLQEIEVILQNALLKLNEMDEINKENLIGITDKMENGFYDNAEVMEKVITEVFPEEQLRKTIEVRMKAEKFVSEVNKLDSDDQIDYAKITQIRERINSGFYNTRDITESVADGLIDFLDV